MSINRFFEETLGANLKNPRWSWGAFDPMTNRVFLRLWEDHIIQDSDGRRIRVLSNNQRRPSNGRKERIDHLNAMRIGTQGFGVVCRAADTDPDGPREISYFDQKILLELGDVAQEKDGMYARIISEVSLSEIARKRTGHSTLTKEIKTIISNKKLENTEKESLVNARVGQGAFRMEVLQRWNFQCAVTGSAIIDAVRASHIKPWRDSTNFERLDPQNGLPLVASLDALFDAGLISFNSDGNMLVSSLLNGRERKIFRLNGQKLSKKPSKVTAEYLSYHEATIFRK